MKNSTIFKTSVADSIIVSNLIVSSGKLYQVVDRLEPEISYHCPGKILSTPTGGVSAHYIFLSRYSNGSSSSDTIPPGAPTNIRVN